MTLYTALLATWISCAATPETPACLDLDHTVQGWQDGVCDEDELCWDCHTMGNRVCGPAIVAPDRGVPVTEECDQW